MKKTIIVILGIVALNHLTSATVVISDDFNDGDIAGWDQRSWFSSFQDNQWRNIGTSTELSGSVSNYYYMLNQTGFTINDGETATISSDFRMIHAGGDPVDENTMCALLLRGSGDGDVHFAPLINRGSAVGGYVGEPIREIIGSIDWCEFGVDPSVGGTGTWFSIAWEISNINGSLEGAVTFANGGGDLFTTPTYTLSNVSGGDTIYAGYTSGWSPDEASSIEAKARMSAVQMDNFEVQVVPEPMSVAFIFSALTLFVVRRNICSSTKRGTGRLYMQLNKLFSQFYFNPAHQFVQDK